MAITLADIALGALAVFLLRAAILRIQAFYNVWTQLRHTPGGVKTHFPHTQFFLAPVLPHFPRWGIGDYRAQWRPYEKTKTSIIASTPLFDPHPMIWISDPAVLKHIGADRQTFPKQTELYDVISFYGPNLVSTEGAEWKRHRDASKSAFGESNNMLVWRESMRAVREWFDVLDAGDTGAVVDAQDVMTRLALLIISSAGFGRTVSYTADSLSPPPPGFTLAFRPALVTAVHRMDIKALATKAPWAKYAPVPGLGKMIEETQVAYEELRRHLGAMIEGTKRRMKGLGGGGVDGGGEDGVEELGVEEGGEGGADLFKLLIRANEEEENARTKLSDSELLSTTYVFLLAGHETTANTLAFAIALLALHPAAQKALQAEVDAVWPSGLPSGLPSDPTQSYREDMPRLKYAEATFRETLRLFPAEVRLTKLAAQDTVLRGSYLSSHPTRAGEKYDVAVPKGAILWLDVWAVHTMREWWGEDAEEFRPERFFDTDDYKWPRDAYMPFSLGARACIGARFATLEGICLLAHIARRYDILLPDEVQALPEAERRRRMLEWGIGVAIQAKGAKVVFRRRK